MTQPALRDVMSKVRHIAGGRAVLGLNIQDTDLGVLVSGVTPSGPAATAGVTVGDTIVAINDVELARGVGGTKARSPSAAFIGELANAVPGDEVELRVLRDGDYRDVAVQAESRGFPFVLGDAERAWQPATMLRAFTDSSPWRDTELVSMTPELAEYFGVDKGLLVVRAGQGADVGLRDGDVVLDIGGRAPQTPEHAMRILRSFEPGESLQVAVMRQRRRATLTVNIPAAGESWTGSQR
jgi:S1-C subfamily serine protease